MGCSCSEPCFAIGTVTYILERYFFTILYVLKLEWNVKSTWHSTQKAIKARRASNDDNEECFFGHS